MVARLKRLSTGKKVLLGAVGLLLLAILFGAGFGSAGEDESFLPQNEFLLEPWIPIDIGGIDLSINKAVLYLFLACAATTLTMVYVAKRMEQTPNRVQTAVEAAYDLTRNNITRNNMSDQMAAKWFGFTATLFFFIWFSNIIGYIPLPINTEHPLHIFGVEVPALALYAATANLSVPLMLTLIVWFAYHVEGIRAKGFVAYLKGWVPGGHHRPGRDPDLLHRGDLPVRADHLAVRPAVREHPRGPPPDPVHGRRPGRAARARRARASSPCRSRSRSSCSRSA